jgi:hypothetical protein
VAEKVRGGAEEVGLSLGEAEQLTSVSIGLVSHPEDGLTAEELMTAADRAMYQAKKLGKNQISGNPRPRPALLARRSTIVDVPEGREAAVVVPEAAEANAASAPAASIPVAEPVSEPAAVDIAAADARAVPVEAAAETVDEPVLAHRPGEEVDDADPMEVRRRIATASRSFDPDHQIRRAMDAFLSPVGTDHERPTPDH